MFFKASSCSRKAKAAAGSVSNTRFSLNDSHIVKKTFLYKHGDNVVEQHPKEDDIVDIWAKPSPPSPALAEKMDSWDEPGTKELHHRIMDELEDDEFVENTRGFLTKYSLRGKDVKSMSRMVPHFPVLTISFSKKSDAFFDVEDPFEAEDTAVPVVVLGHTGVAEQFLHNHKDLTG